MGSGFAWVCRCHCWRQVRRGASTGEGKLGGRCDVLLGLLTSFILPSMPPDMMY